MTEPDATPLESDLDELSWLRRLARRLVADAHRADDAVQETWLAARGKRPTNRRGFLATLLRNRLRQDLRGEGRRDRREGAVGRGRATRRSRVQTARRPRAHGGGHQVGMSEPPGPHSVMPFQIPQMFCLRPDGQTAPRTP